jgi:hypothetical protein
MAVATKTFSSVGHRPKLADGPLPRLVSLHVGVRRHLADVVHDHEVGVEPVEAKLADVGADRVDRGGASRELLDDQRPDLAVVDHLLETGDLLDDVVLVAARFCTSKPVKIASMRSAILFSASSSEM